VPGLNYVIGIDESESGQALQGVVEVGNLLSGELELVGRLVVHHDCAIAVEDQAAAGWDRLGAYSITL
jgi:hypothetical protein